MPNVPWSKRNLSCPGPVERRKIGCVSIFSGPAALPHANARIFDGQNGLCQVRGNLDEEVWLVLNLVRISDGLIADLVQSIRSIRNQLTRDEADA